MYQAFQNKKYYLAFNTFPITAKDISNVYKTGIRNWVSDDMFNYSLVIHRFRIILSIKRQTYDCTN